MIIGTVLYEEKRIRRTDAIKSTESEIYDYSDRSIKLERKKEIRQLTFTRKAQPLTREEVEKIPGGGMMNFCCTVHILCAGSFILNVSVI